MMEDSIITNHTAGNIRRMISIILNVVKQLVRVEWGMGREWTGWIGAVCLCAYLHGTTQNCEATCMQTKKLGLAK